MSIQLLLNNRALTVSSSIAPAHLLGIGWDLTFLVTSPLLSCTLLGWLAGRAWNRLTWFRKTETLEERITWEVLLISRGDVEELLVIIIIIRIFLLLDQTYAILCLTFLAMTSQVFQALAIAGLTTLSRQASR